MTSMLWQPSGSAPSASRIRRGEEVDDASYIGLANGALYFSEPFRLPHIVPKESRSWQIVRSGTVNRRNDMSGVSMDQGCTHPPLSPSLTTDSVAGARGRGWDSVHTCKTGRHIQASPEEQLTEGKKKGRKAHVVKAGFAAGSWSRRRFLPVEPLAPASCPVQLQLTKLPSSRRRNLNDSCGESHHPTSRQLPPGKQKNPIWMVQLTRLRHAEEDPSARDVCKTRGLGNASTTGFLRASI
ncbi:hypothetical protein BP5796_06216 [Coleophoma crateriformis]|uniref:Uncharacterized protein n=1 Tax=Coleophoma crateriformis TaxID=565419 RepID=A0A3D8RWZ9_9HELO|nr:hypothetical protein BP5796_06216 [Coleophoma crateriformis]